MASARGRPGRIMGASPIVLSSGIAGCHAAPIPRAPTVRRTIRGRLANCGVERSIGDHQKCFVTRGANHGSGYESINFHSDPCPNQSGSNCFKNRRTLRLAHQQTAGWRKTYVITACALLYFNVFALVVRSFEKVPQLKAIAPTQKEPPFETAQIFVFALFFALTTLAVKRFRVEEMTVTKSSANVA